jgi:hypothetical protein
MSRKCEMIPDEVISTSVETLKARCEEVVIG